MANEPIEGSRMMRGARPPNGARGRFRAVFVALIGAVAIGGLIFGRDPRRELVQRVSPVASVARELRADLGPRIERWRMVMLAGDTLEGLWRGAPPSVRSPWTIVLLGGIGTDDRAALVVPEDMPAHVLAMRWPWHGARRMSTTQFLAALPAMREALVRSPATMVAGVEAAEREAGPERIALLGVSLGVPTAIAAASLTGTPRALILVDGAADLRHLMRHELGRQRVAGWLAGPAARLGAWLLAPLEPRVHARSLAARRVLLFNSRRDDRAPEGGAARLHALFPRATVVWRGGTHILPTQSAVIDQISARTVDWLDQVDEP